ncbi:MAG TPA: GumC family protein [Devosia sp.]|nr:GumC family protein [Devosia sp.]
MSSVWDSTHPPKSETGERPYRSPRNRAVGERPVSRVAEQRPAPRPQAPQPQVETVTLEKIGDFLELDLRRISVWLRRGLPWIAALAVIGAIGGAAYGVLSKPSYTVTSDILIDPAGLQVLGDDASASSGQPSPDAALLAAASKLRVMTSGNVLNRVVSDLRLAEDPEFADPASAIAPDVAALATLRKSIKITADEKSFVASMAVTTEDVDKSILISNAIFVTFQDELARAESEGSDRIVDGIDGRLDTLKQAANTADAAVEDYKRSHGLQSSAGELNSALLLNQLNAQMVTAQGQVIAAQSAYDQLRSGGTGSQAGQNATLDALRTQLATSQQKLQSQSMIYGARHPIIVQAQTEVNALQAQVAGETTRGVAAAKTRLDEANAALAALTAKSESQQAAVFSDNQALVELHELERDAKSKAAVYEAFLSRSQQLSQSGDLDTSNVRVISTAMPPLARSWPPRTMLMVILGGGAGLGLGLMLALGMGIFGDIRGSRPPRPA